MYANILVIYYKFCNKEWNGSVYPHWMAALRKWCIDHFIFQGFCIIGFNISCDIDNKDEKTKKAIDSYRNKYVEQNCHKDDEIK